MLDSAVMLRSTTPAVTTFGEFLKFLRRRARMTQRELSIAVGYSISQISRLEQNERLPDEMTILAVFVPALGLEKEPALVAHLLALAKSAHAIPEDALPSATTPLPPRLVEQPFAAVATHNNLPCQLTSFVGRTSELSALVQQVATARLVTLTGVGGVGKTRLALTAAQAILDATPAHTENSRFPDGVWFVELAALHEAMLVVPAILATFQLPPPAGRTPTEALLLYLKQKQMLLLLDNCEHLIATCADLVDRILRSCPHVTILATSREALNVDGEVEWPVKPLATPALSHTPTQMTAVRIGAFEAVQLLQERVRTIRPDWQLTDQNAAVIAQICTQLDGIPLALELAAACLKGLTVEDLAARLDDRLDLLTHGRRTALLRHQTLRAVIDWSYDLLSEAERRLLRRLGVFADGWTLAAAEALAEDEAARRQTLPLLLQLVNKSLVVVDETGIDTRYHRLETVRQYASMKLQEAGASDATRQAHCAYFLTLAEQSTGMVLIGPSLSTWLNQIVVEYGNLRMAFAWACQQPDGGVSALRLAGALGSFWVVRGEFSEGSHWLEKALAYDQGRSPVARAWVLTWLADLSRFIVQPQVAMLEEALALFTAAQETKGIGYCLQLLGAAALGAAAYEVAIVQLEQCVQLARHHASPLPIGTGLWVLGDAYSANGQSAQAIACFEECIALGRQYEERLLMARPLIRLNEVAPQRALQLCQAELQRPQPNRETQAALWQTLGRILADQGRYTEAQRALAEALGLWRQLGIKWSMSGGVTRALLDLGMSCFWTADDAAVVRYMTEAQQHYTDVGDSHGVAWTQVFLGHVALRQQQPQAALTYFRASLRHSSDSSMNYLPLALCGIATTFAALGKPTIAFTILGAATYFESQRFILDLLASGFFMQALREARRQLNDPHLAAAWATGQAMTVEKAVAYALEASTDSN
ncbi:MAG: hypothetical protein DYG89_14675 [Caldilinea sp. CFX5]|nr:hypothetical protein [Caldilinea sp. CFX5]